MKKTIIAISIFIITFSVYVKTLAPTITWGDSGNLVSAVYTWGIPHSSGFPFYLLIARLFTYLPLGNPAWKINLMSALFGSLSCVLLYFLLQRLKVKQFISIIVALLFGFSRDFWEFSTVTEVYTLHIFLIIIALFLIFKPNKSKNTAYLLSLTAGILCSTHIISVILLPLFLFHIIQFSPEKQKHIYFINAMLLFTVGLLFYLYLPIAAILKPKIETGFYMTENTWYNLYYFITGKGYYKKLQFSMLKFFENFMQTPQFFIQQFSLPFTTIGTIGMFVAFKKNPVWFISLGFLIASFVLFYANLTLLPTQLLLPGYLAFAVCIAFGITYIESFIPGKKLLFPLRVFVVIILIFVLQMHYSLNNRSNHTSAYRFGKFLLHTLEKDSILFTASDFTLFPTRYLRYIEGVCSDVTILPFPFYSDLHIKAYNYSPDHQPPVKITNYPATNKFLGTYIKKYPIYFTSTHGFCKGFENYLRPYGIIYKLNTAAVELTEDDCAFNEQLVEHARLDNLLDRNDRYVNYYIREFYYDRGLYFLAQAKTHRALDYFKRAYQIEEYSPHVYYKMACIYQENNNIEQAITYYQLAIKHDSSISGALGSLGILFAKSGKKHLAEKHLKRAIRLAKDRRDRANYYYNLGKLYSDTHTIPKAINCYKHALKLSPELIPALGNLAIIYARRGRINEARACFHKILRLEPENTNALKNLKTIDEQKQ
ncbi:MAG: DUF2723 domain-containing protein [Candidatus Omnitrophota bacterium]